MNMYIYTYKNSVIPRVFLGLTVSTVYLSEIEGTPSWFRVLSEFFLEFRDSRLGKMHFPAWSKAF